MLGTFTTKSIKTKQLKFNDSNTDRHKIRVRGICTYSVIQTHIHVTAMLMRTFGSEEKLTFDTSGRLKQEIIQIQARSISRMSNTHLACSRHTHIPDKLTHTHTHTHHEI